MTTQQPDQARPDERVGEARRVLPILESTVGPEALDVVWIARDLLDQLDKARDRCEEKTRYAGEWQCTAIELENERDNLRQQLEAAQAREEATKLSMASIEKREAKRENEYMALKRQLDASKARVWELECGPDWLEHERIMRKYGP